MQRVPLGEESCRFESGGQWVFDVHIHRVGFSDHNGQFGPRVQHNDHFSG